MRGKHYGTQPGDGAGEDDGAQAHESLFDHGGQADPHHVPENIRIERKTLLEIDPDISFRTPDRVYGHHSGDALAYIGRPGSPLHSHRRKAEFAIDHDVVENHVDHVGRRIVYKGHP